MGKTLIFGGTFNPPHIGHVQMAQAAAALSAVEEVWILPTKLPVHKFVGNALASGEHRMQMCRLAFGGIEKIRFSDMELQTQEKNYSLTTVRALKAAYPKKEFAFLIGGDSLIHFHEWYHYWELLQEIPLYVFGRGDCSPAAFDAALQARRAEQGNIRVIDEEIDSVSSAEIREKLRTAQSVTGLVPEAVEDYIRQHGLYLEGNGFDG
ncbi:MAG: nicotinate (nicotinamide) nucleotide adenylyltransferase [Clostridia bacterium]|nr:nicotinate (nicotinamide) nucleotide adenylyltransferase [Clostridia bacterium]